MSTPAALPSAHAGSMSMASALNIASPGGAANYHNHPTANESSEPRAESFHHVMARALSSADHPAETRGGGRRGIHSPVNKGENPPASSAAKPVTKAQNSTANANVASVSTDAGTAKAANQTDDVTKKDAHKKSDKSDASKSSKEVPAEKSTSNNSQTQPDLVVPMIASAPTLPTPSTVSAKGKAKDEGAKPPPLPGTPVFGHAIKSNADASKLATASTPGSKAGSTATRPAISLAAKDSANSTASSSSQASMPADLTAPDADASAHSKVQAKTDGEPQANPTEAVKMAFPPGQSTKSLPDATDAKGSSAIQPDPKTLTAATTASTSGTPTDLPNHADSTTAPNTATPLTSGTSPAANAHPTTAIPAAVASQTTAGNDSAIGKPAETAQTSETSVSSAASKTSGTAVAQETSAMKNTAEQNKVAGQTEKVLPGSSHFVADRKNSPTPQTASTAPHAAEASVSADQNMPSTSNSAGTVTSSEFAAASPKASTTAVEHTHEAVALNAIRLQESGASSLRVVIKPDAGTQLSLELRQHEGRVEAQAVLQNGDFSHLNHHWSELQQRLEQRGVKLAALTSDQGNLNFSGNSQHQFQQSARHSLTEETVGTHRPVRFATAGLAGHSDTTAPARRSLHRGWETWA